MATPLTWLEEMPRLPRGVRLFLVVGMHVMLFTTAYLGSFLIRFDFDVPVEWQRVMWNTVAVVVSLKMLVFWALRMFQGWWKYVSLRDVTQLARGLAVASVAFLVVNVFLLHGASFPRSIYILDFGLALFLIGGARGSLRILREAARSVRLGRGDKMNLLILGAGDTGETLLREIQKNPNLPFRPIGFLDDDAYKHGLRIHGVPVLGPIATLQETVQTHDIQQIIIAMPSASREEMRRVVESTKATGVQTRILPAVEAILEGRVSLNQLREVSIQDILGREPVHLDTRSIGRFLQGRRVLVTGAGGSIGSEICRQVLRFDPARLIMVERGETPLFAIHRELRSDFDPELLDPYIANVADRDRMERIFATHSPEVVIHAAAYKHVPLMEMNPSEAVLNNVGGTRVVADLAGETGVENFVLISTDKAVNPTSVMGATKRVTELYVLSRNDEFENTDFCAVRFGNVLGSNGSVVPIFREQIRNGGPVTVTHPEMTRYFMTIPEASQLVLQAAAIGHGGEVFVLDMGEPVKIDDLARDMIRLSGASEDEVEIVYTGVRPGEKLFEELSLDAEDLDKTRHHKIFIGKNDASDVALLRENFHDLLDVARIGDPNTVRAALKRIVPLYGWEGEENIVPLRPRGGRRKMLTPVSE
jgi:FlaA1/EpsC-like NDP-sugar epimerase